MNHKKIVFTAIIALLVLVLTGCSKESSDGGSVLSTEDNSSIIFFYGKECPHCKNVEKYFADNNTGEKIQFSQKEVYHNKANASLMAEKTKECGIKESELGVPLLWAEGKFYIGDKDIIDFFNQKINEK